MTTVTISLPESLRDFVESRVKAGGHGNGSEYPRGLLHDAQERESGKRLEKPLLEGLDSGQDIEITPQYRAQRSKSVLGRIRHKEIRPKKQRPE